MAGLVRQGTLHVGTINNIGLLAPYTHNQPERSYWLYVCNEEGAHGERKMKVGKETERSVIEED
jgi:hypothetical protein